MSELYRVASAITRHLEQQHGGDVMGLIRAKGEVATRTGFLVTLITPHDPDDPDKVRRLRDVAAELDIAV